MHQKAILNQSTNVGARLDFRPSFTDCDAVLLSKKEVRLVTTKSAFPALGEPCHWLWRMGPPMLRAWHCQNSSKVAILVNKLVIRPISV
jgi:hypothetical protein